MSLPLWMLFALGVVMLELPFVYTYARWRASRRRSLALLEEQHTLLNFLATARLVVAALRDAHRDGKADASALSLAGAWIEQVDKYREANEARRVAALAVVHRAEDGRR